MLSILRTPNLTNPQSRIIVPASFRAVFSEDIRWATTRLADLACELDRQDVVSENERLVALQSYLGMKALVQEETARDFIKDNLWAEEHEPYRPEDLLYVFYTEILSRPGASLVFRDLLEWVERQRVEFRYDEYFRDVQGRMIAFLVAKATERMEKYEEVLHWNRELKYENARRKQQNPKAVDLEKRKVSDPPASIYRDYGLALRYASEVLGFFKARRMLAKLMMASPLPVDELEAPDWIDGYTGEKDPDAEALRVRATLSGDGKLDVVEIPATLADLLSNLQGTNRQSFTEELVRQGMNLEDYWHQFLEAQRSGYSPEVGAELEEHDWDTPDDRVKPFQFEEMQDDLKVTEAVSIIRNKLDLWLVRDAMQDGIVLRKAVGHYFELVEMVKAGRNAYFEHKDIHLEKASDVFVMISECLRKLKIDYEAMMEEGVDNLVCQLANLHAAMGALVLADQPRKDIWAYHNLLKDFRLDIYSGWAHDWFIQDDRTRRFTKQFNRLPREFNPQDLMAVLLPYQNGFAFLEDDLYLLECASIDGNNLGEWMDVNGAEFLEQYANKEDVDYGDKATNLANGRRYVKIYPPTQEELDKYAREFVAELQAVYLQSEEKRLKFREQKDAWLRMELKAAFFLGLWKEFRVADFKAPKVFTYKQDVRWHKAFVPAEVFAAVNGEGGSEGAIAAGWDAWREAVDPEANERYRWLLQSGKKQSEAQAAFMAIYKNRIAKVWKDGLSLRSGRKIDWGIAIMKFDKGEILPDFDRELWVLEFLKKNGWGIPLQRYLEKRLFPEGRKPSQQQ